MRLAILTTQYPLLNTNIIKLPKDKLDQLLQKNKELHILNQIAQQLNSEAELESSLDKSLSLLVDLMNLQTGWIWLLTEDQKAPYLAASYQLPQAFMEHPHLLAGDCYCLEKLAENTWEEVSNINEIKCTRLKDISNQDGDIKYHASVALLSNQVKIGMLNVAGADWQQLQKEQLQLLYTIGDMISMAINRSRLFQKSKQLGETEERNRLAREMHDTLAQGLAAISIQLEVLDAQLETENISPTAIQKINQIKELAQENLSDARRSVTDLRRSALNNQSLSHSIKTLINSKLEESDINFRISISSPRPLSTRYEMGIYRIIQEAINNVLQHSKAKKLDIALKYEAKQLQLHIKDDGIGFDLEKVQQNRFGLLGMNERVKILNGQMQINSQNGTDIQIQIPL